MGVNGNKTADNVASISKVAGGKAMDGTDILNIIRDTGQIVDSRDELEFTSWRPTTRTGNYMLVLRGLKATWGANDILLTVTEL